jgi:hypothetical protein
LAKKRSVGCSSATHIGAVVAEPPAGRLSEAASSAPPTRNGSLPATTAAPPPQVPGPRAFEVALRCRYVLALLAQFAGDFLSAAVRERLGHGLATTQALTDLREVWFVDSLL